ncbi:Stc1 domain-containing protein [Colletotrichum godetiae]|uniref:Stc1 domain-containing protein n=1 Tax=Colletotrichum godetiae TaxID=1209918 RepID=A0AAJ0AIB6_9PEZI|nr:Stc1 domain-containing protein [Colletotrichum godetiae]KAK1674419.1 Stc1 domain-containing protein [Colletotrichum godetiae]
MSSYHSSGPSSSQDLGQKLGQNMAEKYRCKIGGEWKPMSGFSKKQQKLVHDKLDRHARVNRANTGMVCRIHSGEPVNEISCEGPCDEIKTLDQFSKNNRTNGVNICKSCQHWINTQEPGYTPWAGPNTQQDLLEDSDEYDARLLTDPSEIFDFNSEVDTPLAPITGTNGIATTDENDLQTGFQSLGLETRQSYAGGPLGGLAARNYLNGGRNAPVSLLDSESIASAATSAILGTTDTAAARINNPFLDINYNAYDPNGQKHLKTKAPTTQAGSSSRPSSMKATSSRTQANEGGRPESGPKATVFATSSVAPSGPWPGNRQGDRKQLTNKEHRELQKGKPSRVFNPIPYGDDDEYSDDE